MPPGGTEIDVVVTTGADPGSVVPALRDAGMRVRETLAGVGVVTGSAPADAIEALRVVEGVLAVEEAREVRLPPPGAPQ